MSVEPVPGVSGLLSSLVEGHVDGVPLLPHVVAAGVDDGLDLVPHVFAGSSLRLRPLDVVVAVPGPALWYGGAV